MQKLCSLARFEMPWLLSGNRGAVWDSNRLALGNAHLIVGVLLAVAVLHRREPQPIMVTAIAATHFISWAFCRWGSHHEDQRSASRSAAGCSSLVGWFLRTLVHYRYAIGQPAASAFALRAYAVGFAYVLEVLISTVEQVEALFVLPGAIVAVWLGIHLRLTYQAIAPPWGNAQPGPAGAIVWTVIQMSLPHLAHLLMRKSLQRRAAASAVPPPGGLAAASGAAPAAKGHAEGAGTKEGVEQQAGGTKSVGASSVKVETELASPVNEPAAGAAHKQASVRDPDMIRATRPGTAGSSSSSAQAHKAPEAMAGPKTAPSPGALQAIQNARMLAQRAGTPGTYKSRLIQPQVIVKLEEHEPNELSPDVITATNTMLADMHSGLRVARACVRIGCTLLVLNLLGPEGDVSAQLTEHIQAELQAWLTSLLAPGTAIPDGAVAHISIDGQQLQATWQQKQGTWLVRQQTTQEQATTLPQLSLLDVEQSVIRLTSHCPVVNDMSAACAGTAAGGHPRGMHRVKLVLSASSSAAELVFKGSDCISAPEQHICGSTGSILYCMARGSWGAWLPVEVMGVEELASHSNADGKVSSRDGNDGSSHMALTLDVDLSQGAHVGAVQLELWEGHTPLLAAPILLLPASAPDALLQEVQLHVEACGWAAPDDGSAAAAASQDPGDNQSQAGTAAWLEDLGQVLFAAECLDRSGPVVPPRTSTPAGPAEAASQLPGTWSTQLASAVAQQHACDAALLSSTLLMAESLLEYSMGEGLAHTAALLFTCICKLKDRLQALGGPADAGPTSGAQGSAVAVAADSQAELRRRAIKKAEQAASTHDDWNGDDVGPSAPSRPIAPAVRAMQSASPSTQQSPAGRHTPSSYMTAARHAVLGFPTPGMEQQYQIWLASRYHRVVFIQGVLVVLWALASLVRMAQDGLTAFLSHLPLHLACGLPYAVSALLAAYQQHRWQEASIVVASIGKTVGTCAAGITGVLPVPVTSLVMCKIHHDVWGPFAFVFAEPMRLPALLCSHLTMLGFDLGLQSICGHQGLHMLAKVVTLRACALIAGLVFDVTHRGSFMQEQLHTGREKGQRSAHAKS